jgi:hypothetical protein
VLPGAHVRDERPIAPLCSREPRAGVSITTCPASQGPGGRSAVTQGCGLREFDND